MDDDIWDLGWLLISEILDDCDAPPDPEFGELDDTGDDNGEDDEHATDRIQE